MANTFDFDKAMGDLRLADQDDRWGVLQGILQNIEGSLQRMEKQHGETVSQFRLLARELYDQRAKFKDFENRLHAVEHKAEEHTAIYAHLEQHDKAIAAIETKQGRWDNLKSKFDGGFFVLLLVGQALLFVLFKVVPELWDFFVARRMHPK